MPPTLWRVRPHRGLPRVVLVPFRCSKGPATVARWLVDPRLVYSSLAHSALAWTPRAASPRPTRLTSTFERQSLLHSITPTLQKGDCSLRPSVTALHILSGARIHRQVNWIQWRYPIERSGPVYLQGRSFVYLG
ncbi:hypothetical protein EV356DRAFT_117952 [Viridothelium virens]|uniref:Uncharacterized protein n=1 Tax=Viridothelium virens TaxID=1048519 RepID=A0A6A6HBP0_VIRVR|nr:hypothetical protein EV356DRAFT_117952 [Viridothelium virens]